MQIMFCLILVSLLKAGLGIRKFKDEYPGVTVCESSMVDGSGHNMPYSYQNLRAHFGGLHRCTHIEGNLVIQNVWNDSDILGPDLSFLNSIIEITGMLVIENNSIRNIILPNLKVIRGEQFKTLYFEEYSLNVSLYIDVVNETYAAQMIFPNLRVISNNSVFVGSEYPLTYLPGSIEWTEFFENPQNQKFYHHHGNINAPFCNPSCEDPGLFNLPNRCWSADKNHCQKKTKCTKKYNEGYLWCFFSRYMNITKSDLCDIQCSGGCFGNKDTQCSVCKTYVNGQHCIESCPSRFISRHGKKEYNRNFKLRVSKMCALTCPENLLQQEDSCVYQCTAPQYFRNKNVCLRCQEDVSCGKGDCNIDVEYLTEHDIVNLTNCEHIVGNFHLSERSFMKEYGRVTVDMLYKHLKHVKKITGDVLIDGSIIRLGNLTFLENLAEITHIKTNSATAALNVFSTDLTFLGLRKLRKIYGNFEERNNSQLCYQDTIPWSRILINNKFDPIYRNCGKDCHQQCGDLGCWGPSSSMCYHCLGVRAGLNCVEKCEDEAGYFAVKIKPVKNTLLYDDGSCRQCDQLCLRNCTGPNPNDCVGGCLYFQEENKCVKNCSYGYFADGKLCRKCNSYCEQTFSEKPMCTGNGSHLGEGGCSFCKKFIEKRTGLFYCFKNTNCPEGFYLSNIKLNKIKSDMPSKSVQVCHSCKAPCTKCYGNSLKVNQYCERCQGYWSDGVCVLQCSADRLLVKNASLSPNDTCPYCDDQCEIGCYEPRSPFSCIKCKNKRFYLDTYSKQFTCLDNCPHNHTFLYEDERSNDTLCVDKVMWVKHSQRINYRKVLIHKVIFMIVGSIIILLFVFSFLIARNIYASNKKRVSEYLKEIYSNIQEPDSRVLLLNKKYLPNMNRLLLIPTPNLNFNIADKPLGTGAFGAVYKGVWKVNNQSNLKTENGNLDVAIKVIQTNRNINIDDIFEETKVMASVSHKHCLRLIGVCLKYEMPCLVTMFVELGSLDKYLRKHKNILSSYDLLSWSEQIANGMAYLEMRGIIHRDLATRNVLLNSYHFVQITDFGLAHILQGTENNEEIVIVSGQVPIRWLALETLINGIYSHKTDIWAYGVTLWEMFTYGQRPYEELDAREVLPFLIQDNRLPQPEICSIEIYEVMNQCWLESATYRPSFHDLMSKFSDFTRYPTYYLNIPNDPCLTSHHSEKKRFNSQCSYELQQYSRHKMSKQCSVDGTILTVIGDYQDDSIEPMLKRQSSNLSWNSRRQHLFSKPNSVLSENIEENESYFESKEGNLLYSGYLEPIKK